MKRLFPFQPDTYPAHRVALTAILLIGLTVLFVRLGAAWEAGTVGNEEASAPLREPLISRQETVNGPRFSGNTPDRSPVLRYRRYLAPADSITEILAGPELYVPFRKEEFQRWADLLDQKRSDAPPALASGERLVRTVLEATLEGAQLIDGAGRFEFRVKPCGFSGNVPTSPLPSATDATHTVVGRFGVPTRPAPQGRIAFSPLGIWIDSPRWRDGTPAKLIASLDGRIELAEHAPFRPQYVPLLPAVLGTRTDALFSDEEGKVVFVNRRGLPVSRPRPDGRITFRWSLRGREESDGKLCFDFELPPALVLELRLRLPEHWMPECPGALIFEEKETPRQATRAWKIIASGKSRLPLSLVSFRPSGQNAAIGFHQKQAWLLSRQGMDVTAGITFDRARLPNDHLLVDLEAPLRPVEVRYGTNTIPWTTVEKARESEDAPKREGNDSAAPGSDGSRSAERTSTEKTRIRIDLNGTGAGDSRELQIVAQCRVPLDTVFDVPRIRIASERFFHRETRAVFAVTRPLLLRRLDATDASRTVPGSALERPDREVFAFQFFNADSRLRMELTTFIPAITWNSATTVEAAANEILATTTGEFHVAEGTRYTLRADVNSGWVVDTIEGLGRNEIVDWDFQKGSGKLSVQWKKPLMSGDPARLRIKSRFQRPPDRLVLESLRPLRLDTGESDMHLIALDPLFPYRFQGEAEVPYLTAAPLMTPVFLRSIMGQSGTSFVPLNEVMRNRLLVREPSKSSYHAEIGGEIAVADEEVRQTYTIHCSPVDGPVDRVLVWFTSGKAGEWNWSVSDESDANFQVIPVPFETEPVVSMETPDPAVEKVGSGNSPAAWEIRFALPRSMPFDLVASRTVQPGDNDAVSLAVLPHAAKQQAELSIRSHSASAIRIFNNRLEAVPYFAASGNTIQPVLATFRYDPKKELEPHPVPALLLSKSDEPATDAAGTPPPDGANPETLPGCRVWSLQLDSQFQSDGTVRNNALFLLENDGRESLDVLFPYPIESDGIFAIRIDDTHIAWEPERVERVGHGGGETRVRIDLPPQRRFFSISVEFGYRSPPLTRQRRLRPHYPLIDVPILSGSWTTWFPPEYDVNVRSTNTTPSHGREARIMAMRWMLGSFDPFSLDSWSRLLGRDHERSEFEVLGRRILEHLGDADNRSEVDSVSNTNRIPPKSGGLAPGPGASSGNATRSPGGMLWGDWFRLEPRRLAAWTGESTAPTASETASNVQGRWNDILFRVDRFAFNRLGVDVALPLSVPKEGTALEKGYRVLEENGLAVILVRGGDAGTPDAVSILFTSAQAAAKCRASLKNLVGERVWLFTPPVDGVSRRGPDSGTDFDTPGSTTAGPGSPLSHVLAFLPAECEWVSPSNWIKDAALENNPWPAVRQKIRFSAATSGWTAIEMSREEAERSLTIVHRTTIATYGGIVFLGLFLLTWRRPLSHPMLLLALLLIFEIIARNIPACYTPIPGGAFLGTLCSLGFSLIRTPVQRSSRMIRREVLSRSVIATDLQTGKWQRVPIGADFPDSRADVEAIPPAPLYDSSPTLTYVETPAATDGDSRDFHSVTTSDEIDAARADLDHGDSHSGQAGKTDGTNAAANGGGSLFSVFLPLALLLCGGLHFAVHGQTTATLPSQWPGTVPDAAVAPAGDPSVTVPGLPGPGAEGTNTRESNGIGRGTDVSATIIPSNQLQPALPGTEPQVLTTNGVTENNAAANDPNSPDSPLRLTTKLPEPGSAPYRVYVPVDANNEPVGDYYWISEEFLRRLYQGVRKESVSGRRWGITRAEYHGSLLSNPVRREYVLSNFRAIFDVELDEETATLQLPFAPESMRWDRTPVQPTWQRTGQAAATTGSREDESLVFVVENQRPGAHQLELTLQPPVGHAEEMTKLLLRIPKVPETLLRLTTPPDLPSIRLDETLGAIRPNGPASPQTAVAELGATGRLSVAWPDRTGPGEETSVDQLFLLRIQPNKEVELQAKFRYYLGEAKTRYLYVATDPDLQLSGPYRLFVNTLPSDQIESVAEVAPDDMSAAVPAGTGWTRITLKTPIGGMITVRADYVVKNFGGIGSLSLPHLSSVKSTIGKSWFAIWVDPSLHCDLSGAAGGADVLRNFETLWAAPVSPLPPGAPDIPLRAALELGNAPPGTLLSIRKNPSLNEVRWKHSLLFNTETVRILAEATIQAAGETFQHTLRVPEEFRIDDFRVVDAEGNACESRWILSVPGTTAGRETTGETEVTIPLSTGNKRAIDLAGTTTSARAGVRAAERFSEYTLFLKRPLTGPHTVFVRGWTPADAIEPEPGPVPSIPRTVPLPTLHETVVLEEGVSLFRTSDVVVRFSGLAPEWTRLETPGPSDRSELSAPFAGAITLGTFTKRQAHRNAVSGGETPGEKGGDGLDASRETEAPDRTARAFSFRLSRNIPSLTGMRVSSLYRRFKEETNGQGTDRSVEGAGNPGSDTGSTGGLGSVPGSGTGVGKTDRESSWEVLSTFEVNIEHGEIDRFVICFDQNSREIGVLDDIDFTVENREGGPVLIVRPAAPVSGRFSLRVHSEVGVLGDAVALPHISLDMERTNLKHYVVLPTEFLSERFEWKVEQMLASDPETTRRILANDLLFSREEIDRTDPESLEDHRKNKTVYSVAGPEYQAALRPPGKGTTILLADITLFLRKDGSLLGIGSYDVRAGEEKRVRLTMPEGFRLIDIRSGANTFSERPDPLQPGKERRLIELWDHLPQRIDLVFTGRIPGVPGRAGGGRPLWGNEPNHCDIPLPVFEEVPVVETLWTLCFESTSREMLPRFSIKARLRTPDAPADDREPLPRGENRLSNVKTGGAGRTLATGERMIDEAFPPEVPMPAGLGDAAVMQMRLARLENLTRMASLLPSPNAVSGLDLRRWYSHWGKRWREIRGDAEMLLTTFRESDESVIGTGIPVTTAPTTPVLAYVDMISPSRRMTATGAARFFGAALNQLDRTHRNVLENYGIVSADRQMQEGDHAATVPLAVWSKSHFEPEFCLYGLGRGTLTELSIQSHPAPRRLIDSVPFHYGIWALVLVLGAALTVRSPVRRFYRRFPHFVGIIIGLLLWTAHPHSGAGALVLLACLAAMLSSPWRKTSMTAERMSSPPISSPHWNG